VGSIGCVKGLMPARKLIKTVVRRDDDYRESTTGVNGPRLLNAENDGKFLQVLPRGGHYGLADSMQTKVRFNARTVNYSLQ
jgi:hypothetical protein